MNTDAPLFDGTQPCCKVDPELFFSDVDEKGCTNHRAAEAIALCKTCPFRVECAQYAYERGEMGIWGGTTTRQRSRWRNQVERSGSVVAARQQEQLARLRNFKPNKFGGVKLKATKELPPRTPLKKLYPQPLMVGEGR